MQFIIDANILFSALIKNSFTAEILFDPDIELVTAEFIIEEFLKYEEEILRKTHRTKEQFIEIMHLLTEIITIIPKEEYSRYLKEAEEISPDPKDKSYFALAMKIKCPIWSNDKKLKEQDRIKICNTSDIIKLLSFENRKI